MKKVFKSKAYKDKLKGHKDGVFKLFSPYGPDSGLLLSASQDGCIRAWDLIERKITTKLLLSREGNEQSRMAVDHRQEDDPEEEDDENQQSDDEDNIKAREENQSYLKKITDNKDISLNKEILTAVCFSQNTVYGGFQDGLICGWNIKSGEVCSMFPGHSKAISEMEFLNTRLLVTASLDSSIRVWDTMNGINESIFKLTGPINLLKIKDKNIQVIIEKNNYVEISADTSKIIRNIRFTSTSITSFITHNQQLIIATIENVLEIYNLENLDQENLQPLYIVETNKDWVLSMKILDKYLYTGGDDRTIKVWDLNKKLTLVENFVGHQDGVASLEFADNMLYSGSFDHSIRSWNLHEMENRIREREHMGREELWSRKYDAWYKVFYKKKKKGKGKKGGAKKKKK